MNTSKQEMYMTRSAKLDSLKKFRLVSIPDSAPLPLCTLLSYRTTWRMITRPKLINPAQDLHGMSPKYLCSTPAFQYRNSKLMCDINKYQAKLHRITGSVSENLPNSTMGSLYKQLAKCIPKTWKHLASGEWDH